MSDFITISPPLDAHTEQSSSLYSNKISLRDKATGNILASWPLSSPKAMEECFAKALEFESYGLEVETLAPSSNESLIQCLSGSPQDIRNYMCSVEQEWKEHE